MIKEFSVGCSKTINLGNYESLRIESSITITVSERDDLGVLRADAQRMLRSLLEETYREQYKKSAQQPAKGR